MVQFYVFSSVFNEISGHTIIKGWITNPTIQTGAKSDFEQRSYRRFTIHRSTDRRKDNQTWRRTSSTCRTVHNHSRDRSSLHTTDGVVAPMSEALIHPFSSLYKGNSSPLRKHTIHTPYQTSKASHYVPMRPPSTQERATSNRTQFRALEVKKSIPELPFGIAGIAEFYDGGEFLNLGAPGSCIISISVLLSWLPCVTKLYLCPELMKPWLCVNTTLFRLCYAELSLISFLSFSCI